MAGTKIGGLKAAATNKEKHGADFYREIGAIGGRNGRNGGFAAFITCHCDVIKVQHHRAQCAGLKGGRKSRRRKKVTA